MDGQRGKAGISTVLFLFAAAVGTEAPPLTRAAAVLDALVVSLGALGDVRTLHFHPGRVSERVNARRLRDRGLARAVDHLVAFATAGRPAPHEATPRLGSAVVGDWAAHKASAGAFRKKPFLTNSQRNQTGMTSKARCFVPPKTVSEAASYRNRDATAARSIALRFVVGKSLGVGPRGRTVAGTAA